MTGMIKMSVIALFLSQDSFHGKIMASLVVSMLKEIINFFRNVILRDIGVGHHLISFRNRKGKIN